MKPMTDAAPEVPRQRVRPPRAQVRERILEAAREVFAAAGFANASLDAIAETAGFTKGAVYSSFASKDELFFALLDQQVAGRLAAVEDFVATTPSPTVEAVGAVLDAGVHGHRQWQVLFTEYWLRAIRDPEIGERFVAHRAVLRDSIEAMVSRWDIDERFSARTVTLLILALNSGLSIEEFSDPGSVPPGMFGDVLRAVVGEADHRLPVADE